MTDEQKAAVERVLATSDAAVVETIQLMRREAIWMAFSASMIAYVLDSAHNTEVSQGQYWYNYIAIMLHLAVVVFRARRIWWLIQLRREIRSVNKIVREDLLND